MRTTTCHPVRRRTALVLTGAAFAGGVAVGVLWDRRFLRGPRTDHDAASTASPRRRTDPIASDRAASDRAAADPMTGLEPGPPGEAGPMVGPEPEPADTTLPHEIPDHLRDDEPGSKAWVESFVRRGSM